MLATVLTAALVAAPATPAVPQSKEEILLVDGRVLEVDRVTAKTYKEVVFRRGGSEGSKPADQVRSINHNLGPAILDEFVRALEQRDTGDFVLAIQTLNDVLTDDRVVGSVRYSWIKQDARWIQIRAMFALGDLEGVAVTVDKLLAEVPDTFFYAQALMAKAEALALDKRGEEALAVFKQLERDTSAKGLPDRWAREAELGLAIYDPNLKGRARQSKLEGLVAKNANDYPAVANRARVEVGNSILEEGDWARAQSFFEKILDGGATDDRTEAGAYAGLGDCYYQRGLAENDAAKAKSYFQAAALHHLRVAVMHEDVVALVPRSMYYAVMSFERMGERRRARNLASRMARAFDRSPWTERVKTDLKVK